MTPAFFDKRPKFIHYQPFSVILTRIEFDHVDIYENLEKVKSSFELLIRALPQDGLLIAFAEDKNILDILPQSSSKKNNHLWSFQRKLPSSGKKSLYRKRASSVFCAMSGWGKKYVFNCLCLVCIMR